jgi:hypothetical protein
VYDALTQSPFLFFFYFVHRWILKKRHIGSWLCFCLQEKKHRTCWTPYIELFSVNHWLRIALFENGRSSEKGNRAKEGKITLWSKQHFVENKTQITQHVSKRSKFPCYLNIYNEFLGVFTNLHLQKSFKINQLTLRTTVLFEKLPGPQLVKKFPSFHETWRFIITFTSARIGF